MYTYIFRSISGSTETIEEVRQSLDTKNKKLEIDLHLLETIRNTLRAVRK